MTKNVPWMTWTILFKAKAREKIAFSTRFSKVFLDHSGQVNLFQKLLFLHQLTHTMTKDWSWNYHENYKRRSLAEHGQNMFRACTFHGNSMNNLLPYCYTTILRVNWCRNKRFWQRFTCNSFKQWNITTFFTA